MFNSELFVKEMTRISSETVGLEIQRALESLWPVNAAAQKFTLTIGNPIIPLPRSVVEIKGAFIFDPVGGKFVPLEQSREILLDIENQNWRTSPNGFPKSFIWHGEQSEIRLNPPPDATYELWLIILHSITVNVPKWFTHFSSLRAARTLASSDQIVGRKGLIDFMKELEEIFIGSF